MSCKKCIKKIQFEYNRNLKIHTITIMKKKYNEMTLFKLSILNFYSPKYTKYLISQNEIPGACEKTIDRCS